MAGQPRFVCALTLLVFAGFCAHGQVIETAMQRQLPEPPVVQQPLTTWEQTVSHWPVIRFLVGFLKSIEGVPSTLPEPNVAFTTPAAQSLQPCSVAPLEPIEDPVAQELEAANGPNGAVDVAGMVPAAARALDRFEAKVASVGGTIVLKSAYRPASYQHHLQDVWYKWKALRNNQEPGCQNLRAQVQEEFAKHHLIESQHPVTVSDHTRGLAFDANVDLPLGAKIGRRRVTLDGLAHLAGLLRPAIATDPVHFKFLGDIKPTRVAKVASGRRGRNA